MSAICQVKGLYMKILFSYLSQIDLNEAVSEIDPYKLATVGVCVFHVLFVRLLMGFCGGFGVYLFTVLLICSCVVVLGGFLWGCFVVFVVFWRWSVFDEGFGFFLLLLFFLFVC